MYTCRKCGVPVWRPEDGCDILKLCSVCSSSKPINREQLEESTSQVDYSHLWIDLGGEGGTA